MCHARDMAVAEVVAVDVGYAFSVRDEVDALAVGCEFRIDVLARAEKRQHVNGACREIDRADVHSRKCELLEIALPAIGHERQRLPVGRERRLHVRVAIVGQAAHRVRADVIQEQIARPILLAGDRDRAAVGRPRDVVDRVDAGDADVAEASAVDILDCQVIVAAFENDEGELLRIRRPGAGRIDEAKRFEVRVACRRRQPPHDLAGPRVGEEEIDVEDVACRQEGEVTTVRAVCRTEVQIAADAALAADDRRAERERPVLDDRVVHLAR